MATSKKHEYKREEFHRDSPSVQTEATKPPDIQTASNAYITYALHQSQQRGTRRRDRMAFADVPAAGGCGRLSD
jgi:hypothetical protein